MTALDPLWQPMRIGAVEIPRRLAVSSHNTAHDDERLAAYLAARAAGGAGLIIMGGVPVHPSSMSSPALIPAWQESAVPRLTRIAEHVKAAAAASPARRDGEAPGALFCQIYHAGPNDTGSAVIDFPHAPMGPSAVAAPPAERIPHVMDQRDIDEIVAGFALTAANLQEAGFDGIEISAGHGYLVHAFLSPTTNHRDDEYGGSPQRRARFALEVAQAIRERCGADFPILLRLTLDERLGAAGMTPESARPTLQTLHESGLFDAYGITGALYATLDETVAPASAQYDAVYRDSAVVAREVIGPDAPLMLAGSIMDVERAAELVTDGVADLVAMTRSHIADPELVLKARGGRTDEIRHCVRGNQGCWRGIKTRQGVTCTVNPVAGRELTWGTLAPATARRVVVVGGGPAGLKAAEVAASRGHQVVLFERDEVLGGQARWLARTPRRGSWQLLVDDLAASVQRLGVELRLGAEADADAVLAAEPDAVIVATGARWEQDGWTHVLPHLTPQAGSTPLTPVEALALTPEPGARAVVLDDAGTYAALGVAEHLSDHGAAVTIVSPRGAIGDHTVLTGEATFTMPRLARAGVRFVTGAQVESFGDGAVSWVDRLTSAPTTIDADLIVACLQRTPRLALSQELAARRPDLELHVVGDAWSPREVDDAVVDGQRVGAQV